MECQIGLGKNKCKQPAAHVFLVDGVRNSVYDENTRDGGVVMQCAFHANTPTQEWDSAYRDMGRKTDRVVEWIKEDFKVRPERWSQEPCGREHIPGMACILPEGHLDE